MKRIPGKLKYSYDRMGDVLYAYIDEPRPAKSYEIEPGIILRLLPDTESIVGCTITHCAKRVKTGHLTEIPFFPELDLNACLSRKVIA